MTARNCKPSWTASVFPVPQDVDDHAPAQTASSLTRATAIRAAGACCGSGRSSTPFQSDATNGRNGQRDQAVRSSSILSSTRGAT